MLLSADSDALVDAIQARCLRILKPMYLPILTRLLSADSEALADATFRRRRCLRFRRT